MNDAGRAMPDHDTGADTGEAEVYVPPARTGDQAPDGPDRPDVPAQGAGEATGHDSPAEPLEPLPGYERL